MDGILVGRGRQMTGFQRNRQGEDLASALADDGLEMVTGHVMPCYTVTVKVVEDGQTRLITLTVVRLGSAISVVEANS